MEKLRKVAEAAGAQVPVGIIRVSRVIHEAIPVFPNGDQSIGATIDAHLEEAMRDDQDITQVAIEITGEMWRGMGGRSSRD